MKKVYILSLLALLFSFAVQAEDYILNSDVELKNFSSGNNKDVKWDNPNAWSPEAPLVSGSSGTITIPNGVTLTLSEAFSFNGTIIVESGGAIIFNRDQPNAGQLIMDESSTIVLEDGASISSAGPAGDNHNYLKIGDFAIDGSEINTLPAPPFAMDVTYVECVDGGGTGCNEMLPVNLLYFTATPQKSAVKLEWASSKAWDFSHYELERSADGKDFEYLASMDAEENTDWVVNYSFEDLQPLSGISYYRLKAVDIDGSFEYKGIEVVQFAAAMSLKAFPNPSSNGFLNILTDKGADARVSLKDNSGRTVYAGTMQNAAKTIDTSSLQPGLYVLIVEGAGAVRQTQVIIQ